MRDALFLAKGLRNRSSDRFKQAKPSLKLIMPKKRCLESIARYKDTPVAISKQSRKPSTTSLTERLSDRDSAGCDSEEDPPPPLLILDERELQTNAEQQYHIDDDIESEDSQNYTIDSDYTGESVEQNTDDKETSAESESPKFTMKYGASYCWETKKHSTVMTSADVVYQLDLIDRKLEEVLDL